MITSLASRGAAFLNGSSENSDLYDLYHYGLECILNECITDGLVLTIGFAFHIPVQMFVWMCVFTICRINMGGWHAPNHFICISCSVVAGLVPALVYITFGVPKYRSLYVLTLSGYLVWCLLKLPLQTSRHIVSAQRRLFAKSADTCLIVLILLVTIVSRNITSHAFFAYVALTEAIILTLPGRHRKQ